MWIHTPYSKFLTYCMIDYINTTAINPRSRSSRAIPKGYWNKLTVLNCLKHIWEYYARNSEVLITGLQLPVHITHHCPLLKGNSRKMLVLLEIWNCLHEQLVKPPLLSQHQYIYYCRCLLSKLIFRQEKL